jgi:hypothetical protein
MITAASRKPENMSLAEEKALLTRFAKAAGAGEMLNIHDFKAAYEKATRRFCRLPSEKTRFKPVLAVV